jgi:hypothetical protein
VNNAATPPVTANDVTLAVALTADALLTAVDQDWHVPAGTLGWDCWETVEHMADDLFAYAAQLGPRKPPQDMHVPFAWQRKREDGPAVTTFADPEGGNAGLIQMFEACGAFLAALVATSAPETRAHHALGLADPEGFAAMGVVEVVVHMHDVAAGLGTDWTPPEDLCDRVLYRLFPEAPTDTAQWPTLLWATGRGDIPGHERITGRWRWYAAPRT